MDNLQVMREAGRSARYGDAATILFVNEAQKEDTTLDDITITEHADFFPDWDEHFTGKRGTIVRDEGKLYKSIHDVGAGQNTKPSSTPAMWTRIGDPGEEWPEWMQPIGAHDAYEKGAKVSHAGKRWTSDVDGNIWEPGVWGWSEVTG
ncbi:alpha-amylase [Oscillospiraceae bacterium OttesenSCG-928-G22]|nr:alpha-amylase [Oscillospiraceae bacterium OttesenSCG-928-G22]